MEISSIDLLHKKTIGLAMKLLALLCIVGFAAASTTPRFHWDSNKEYTFEYSGRLLTGIPDLATHFSGLGIRCQVKLTPSSQGRFVLKIDDARFSRVNQALKGQQTQNWRQVSLPAYESVPQEAARYLSKGTVFELKSNGEFQQMTVDRNEPEWSVNFKKGLVSLFQSKMETSSLSGLEDNMIQSTSDNGLNFWKTSEQSLDGVCDVSYQLNRLPTYQAEDETSNSVPNKDLCHGGKVYELIKSKDASSCSKSRVFSFYKPGKGNCKGISGRSSVTRYVACGEPSSLKIQYIENEGEVYQNLLGYKTEKFLTGNKQTLRLVRASTSPVNSPVSASSSDKVLRDLYYQYTQTPSGADVEILAQQSGWSSKLAHTLPRNQLSVGTISGDDASVKEQIEKMVEEIVDKDLHGGDSTEKKEMTMKVLSVARAITLLDQNTVTEIYHSLKQHFSNDQQRLDSVKNVYFDIVSMGGSPSNINFLKSMIERREMNALQAASFFTTLPQNVLVPKKDLLESLFQLVTSDAVRGYSKFTYTQAVIGFSTLLQRACLDGDRHEAYPSQLYGEFCSHSSEIVVGKWIPYLDQQLQKDRTHENKKLMMLSLYMLSHEKVLPIIVRELDATDNGPTTRFLAVYVLSRSGHLNRDLSYKILFAILNNQAEETEVRSSAFNTFLHLNPSVSDLQRIAALTWRESDKSILQIITTSFRSLALQYETVFNDRSHQSIQRKAWLVYPLVKKTETNALPGSANLHLGENLHELGINYQFVVSWLSLKDSAIPTDFYYKLTYLLDNTHYLAGEFGVKAFGTESLLQKVAEAAFPSKSFESRQEQAENIKKHFNSEMKQVIEQIGIKSRSDSDNDIDMAVWLNFFKSFSTFGSFQGSLSDFETTEKIQKLLGLGSSSGINPGMICGNHKVNVQKMLNLAPAEYLIPSDMGFPIITEVHRPTVISMIGNLDVQCGALFSNVKVSLKSDTQFASQYSGWVGTVLPFTKETLLTVIDERSSVSMPTEIAVTPKMEEQQVRIQVKPSRELSKPVSLAHYSIRPFTVRQNLNDLRPFSSNHNSRDIDSPTRGRQVNWDLFDYTGLNLQSKIYTQSAHTDFRSLIEQLRMVNYHPANLFVFSWASTSLSEKNTPSLRRHSFDLVYDLSNDNAVREVDLVLGYGVATKIENHPAKYHTVKPSYKSLFEKVSYPAWKNLIPVEVQTETLGQSGQHALRQKNLKEAIEENEIQVGQAHTFTVGLELQGGLSRRFQYSLVLANGQSQSSKTKWSCRLINEETKNKVCVDGAATMPRLPKWSVEEILSSDVRFDFHNTFGYGVHCQERQIKITGHSSVSEEQKSIARSSELTRQYKRMVESQEPLAKLSPVAKMAREQASTLDRFEFDVEYVNVDQDTYQIANYIAELLKGVMWPYKEFKSYPDSSSTFTNKWIVKYNSKSNTFDLTMKRRSLVKDQHVEEYSFEAVRIPRVLNLFYPIYAINQDSLLQRGSVRNPVCSVEGKHLRTYTNQTIPAPGGDKCFHVLSSDCSDRKTFAVLLRNLNQDSNPQKEVKVIVKGYSKILLTPRGSEGVRIVVNGTQVNVGKDQHKTIRGFDLEKVAEIYRSSDNVVTVNILDCPLINSPTVSIVTNGQEVEVKTSYLFTGKVCGVCGELTPKRVGSLQGPGKCVYSKASLFVASYRLDLPTNGECQALPRSVKDELEKENAECVKVEDVRTRVKGGYQSGSCTKHSHVHIRHNGEVCFSRVPVTGCGSLCQAESLATKTISMGCVDEGRLAESYLGRVQNREIIDELANLPERFTIRMSVPRSCSRL